MKLIINIPDKAYELLKSKSELDNIAESIIANGTPISTNGDLISREALKKTIKAQQVIDRDISPNATISYHNLNNIIDNAPTISPYKAIHDELHKGEQKGGAE